MKKLFPALALVWMMSFSALGQNSVGINTSTPNSKAVLELVSPTNNQGFLVPRLTTSERNAMGLSNTDRGMMVYDTDLNQFWHWDGIIWKAGLGVLGETEAGGDLEGVFPNPTIRDNAVDSDELANVATNVGAFGTANDSTILEITIDEDGRVRSVTEKGVRVGSVNILDASILGEDIASSTITLSKIDTEGNTDKVLATDPSGLPYWEDASRFTSALLATDNIYVGNVDGVAAGLPVVGDISIINTGTEADVSIKEDSVTADKINADVAGEGVSQNTSTGALDINAGNGIRIVSDSLELAFEEIDGDGLVADLGSQELDVNVDDATLEVDSDVLQVKDLGITNDKIQNFSILPEAKISPANPITGINYQNRILVINEASEVDWTSIGQSTVLTTTSSGAIFGRPLSDFATNSLLPGAIFIGDGAGNAQQLQVSSLNNILVGNGTGISSVTMIGDANIVNPSGLIEIQNNAVQGDDIDATDNPLNIAGDEVISFTTSNSSSQAIQLNATGGAIDIGGSQGVLIDATSDDIDINAIAGSLNLTSNQGVLIDADNNDITIDAIAGSVNIDGNQNITLTSNNIALNPTSNANITTTSGAINLNSGSAVDITGDNSSSFSTTIGDIDINSAGQLDLDGGSTVAIDGATGVTVSSTANNVTISSANDLVATATSGQVDINADDGDVTIDAAGAGSDVIITAADQISLSATNTQVSAGSFQLNTGQQVTDITSILDPTGDDSTLPTEKAVRDALNSGISANNGLNESTEGNIQLGGELDIANTEIIQGLGEALTISNTADANTTIRLTGTGDFVVDGLTGDVTVDEQGLLSLENGITVSGGTVNLGTDAVQSNEITDGTVSVDDIGSGAVGSDEIINSSIETIDINNDAVTSDKIDDQTIQTADLANDAVTLDQLGTGGVADGNKIYITDAAGDPTFADIASFTTTILAEGNIYIGNAAGNATELDAKTSGNILVGNGTTLTSVGATGDVTIDGSGDIQLRTDAVTAAEILDGTVGSDEIGTGAVNSDEIATDAVGFLEIATNAVGSDEIVSGAVEADELANNAVITDKISDNNVTLDKIVDGTADQILGTDGSGDPIYIDQSSIVVGTASNLVATSSVVDDSEVDDDITISGGSIDNSVIGGGTPAAGTFTTINATTSTTTVDLTATGTVSLGTDQIESSEITDETIEAVDIAEDAVTAEKINSNVAGTGLQQNMTTGALEADFGNLANLLSGNGLDDDGTDGTLDIQVDGNTIEINGNSLRVVPEGIDNAQLADGAVTTDKILAGTILTGDIADDAILTDDIRDGTIEGVDIADNTVTLAKIQDGGANQILVTTAGGDPTYVDQTSIVVGTASDLVASSSVVSDLEVDNDLTINGGTIDNSVIGASGRAAGNFTNLDANGTLNADGSTTLNGNTEIGDAPGDVIDITGVTNLNGGSVTITSDLSLASGATVDNIVTSVGVTGSDSNLPTEAAVRSAINATSLTDGEGTSSDGTSVNLGGGDPFTGSRTVDLDANTLTFDVTAGGSLVVDGVVGDVSFDQNGLLTAGNGLTVSGTVTLDANEIGDGEVVDALTIDGGTVNNTVIGGTGRAAGNFTNVDASGTITGGTLTDGAFSTTSGAVTGVTTLGASSTVSAGALSTTGNIDLDGTLQFDAGQTVEEITTTVNGSSTNDQLPTAAAVNSAISATALTNGEGTTANGTAIDLGGTVTTDRTLTVGGNSIIVDNNGGAGTLVVSDGTGTDVTTIGDNQVTVTDGVTTSTLGVNSLGTGSVTATGTVQGLTLTDGVASMNLGAITNATNITGSGTITGGTLTDGAFSTTSGAVTGVTTLGASSTVSAGALSTTGNIDLDGTLQFDAGQTVEEITTTVNGSSTNDQLPTAAAVNSAISATALTNGEGTTANGTAIDLGGTVTTDRTLTVGGNSIIVDNNGGAGTLVVSDGTGTDVTTIGDNQVTVTDGVTTSTLGVNSLGTGSVTATGTVQGLTLTDGVASMNLGAITNATNITGSGTITGGTLTDGAFSTTSGAVTGVTTLGASSTVSAGALSTTGNIDLDGTLQFDAGQTVEEITTTVNGSSTNDQLPTAAAVNSAISATALTNGEGTTANGTAIDLGGTVTTDRTLTVGGNSIIVDNNGGAGTLVVSDGTGTDVTTIGDNQVTVTDGVTTSTLGVNSLGTGSVTATGTVQGLTLTDGVASMNLGAITNATNITGSGTITGGTLTDGAFSTTSGAVTGVTTLGASSTVSAGALSTTGNIDLDGTLQFDAGQTVEEITTTVNGSSTNDQLPTAAAVNSAISATALTNGEGTTANGTAIDLGGTVTTDRTLTVGGNSIIVDNNGGAGTLVVSDGTGTDVTTIGDNQVTVTDGVTTSTLGVNSLGTGSVTATGTVQGLTLTDGVASMNLGAITNATNITGSGTITGGTLTDGAFSTTSGAVTGVTTLGASSTVSAGALSTTGNIDLDGTLQFDAGQTVEEITTTVNGSSTNDQLPTAAAVNSAISATALTNGEGTTANGTAIDLGGTVTSDRTLTVGGNSIIVDNNGGAGTLVVSDGTGTDVTTIGDNQVTVTDGVTTSTLGVNSLGTGSVTATGTVQGLTLTDGVASMNLGAITNATNITGSGTITGGTLTDGAFSTTSGAVTGVTTLGASSTVSAGALSTTGNIDLDGTLQFDAGQTVEEITTTVNGSSTNDQLPTAAAVNSAISATALTNGEGTTANGTAIDLGGTVTTDRTLTVGGNSIIVDNNGGAGTLVVSDGTGTDVTTIGDNQVTVTDGVTTSTLGVNSLGTGSVTATGTVQGLTLTDGVASMNLGAITNATNITGSGTITGGTLTDGAFSTTSGAVTGVTTLGASSTVSAGALSTTGNIDLDGTLQFDAGQTVEEITTTVNGSSTNDQLPTAAAVNSAISATALTNGEGTTANGTAIDLGGTVTTDRTLTVGGNSIIVDNNGGAGTLVVSDGTGTDVTTIGDNQVTVTDGVTTSTLGVNSLGTGSVTATGTVQGLTLTDGVASMNLGAITNATNITGSGTITGGTLTDGAFSTTSGAVTGVTTLGASSTVSAGALSTTGNIDLDGTLQFDAGQTVEEITTTVNGSSTNDQLPTAAAVNSAISATALTNGEGTTANGTAIDLGGTVTTDRTLTVGGNSIIVDNNGGAGTLVVSDGTGTDVTTIGDNQVTVTDGVTTSTLGVNSLGTGSVTATGTVQGLTLTDGVASMNLGAITNATNITGSGTITGGTLTDGAFSTTSGAVTGVTTLGASSTVSAGALSTTGNIDLDGTLQFDAGQTVEEISTETDLDNGGGALNTVLPTQLAVKTYVDNSVGAISVSLQDAYDGGQAILTDGSGALSVSGTNSINLVSSNNVAGAVSLESNTGASGTITLTNVAGTSSGAIRLDAQAGGVEIEAANNSDISLTTSGSGLVVIPLSDINGGTIDNTTIGGDVAAAGTFTNLSANQTDGGNLRLSGNIISSTNTDGNITLTPDGTGNLISSSLFQANNGISVTSGNITLAGSATVDGEDVSALGTEIDDLVSLSGVAVNSTDLGAFTGDIIPNSRNVKEALQDLETDLDAIQNLSGVADAATDLGTFNETIISDNVDVKTALQELETSLAAGGSTDDQVASEVPFTPITGITSNNVQDAFGDVLPLAGGAISGDLTIGDAGTDVLTINSSFTIIDNFFTIVDDGDATKQVGFFLGDLPSGQFNRYRWPDNGGVEDTLVSTNGVTLQRAYRNDNTLLTRSSIGNLIIGGTEDLEVSNDLIVNTSTFRTYSTGKVTVGGYTAFPTTINDNGTALRIEGGGVGEPYDPPSDSYLNDDPNITTGSPSFNISNADFAVDGGAAINGDLAVAGFVYLDEFTITSDGRLKKDINQISGSLESINDLRGVTYKWRQGTAQAERDSIMQYGVIAQEIEKVYPELVKTHEGGLKTVNYQGLIPILLEAIKEQQQLIESLQVALNDEKTSKADLKDALSKQQKLMEMQTEAMIRVQQENENMQSDLDQIKAMLGIKADPTNSKSIGGK